MDDFEIVVADLDEDAMTCEDPWKTAERLAEAKALAVWAMRPEALVIGGDTVVALPTDEGHRQLTKPIDADDALRILMLLNGREHLVITGVSIVVDGQATTAHDSTVVRFRSFSENEARDYIVTGEPMDKAGAYGIQGLGGTIVEEYVGSLTNVVGLPIELLGKLLLNGNAT